MPRIKDNKRYASPNSKGNDRRILVHKKIQRKKGNYILEETIGEGAFAKVKLGTHIHTGEKVAIKILNKEKLFEEALEDNLANGIEGCDIQKIRKEINILKRLRHKNVIQLYEIMESKTNLYIVMEYCEGKELFDYIVKNKYLSEKEACRFFQQIIDGVEYLHLSNITHRDLKPENLLLDNKKRIRISDFGLSNMGEKIDSLLETPCGTPSYAPPEMLRGEKYNGVFSDIWSCGIILYTMLVGNLPCAESKEDLIYENIMTHNYYYPENISDEAIDLIENMLKVDPSERYDFDQIKSHPWFNLVEPKLKPGIVYGIHKIPVDENILNKVETFGYDKKKVMKSIENYNYDENCSIYYLTLKQFTRENKASISDLFSDKYLKYLQNYKNWLKPEEINNPLFMNYEVEMPFEIEQEKAKNYISNALLAYNDKANNKKYNKGFEDIPEEKTKISKIFDNSNDEINNESDLNQPLSARSKKSNINKRIFNNEIEKFKNDENEKLNLTIIQNKESKKRQNIQKKNKNIYTTEKKNNINNQNMNTLIASNINRPKKFQKKSKDINSSAKKINNNSLFFPKMKTPNKKTKIRKNSSYGEISNYDKNNHLNIGNIQEIIKKRVKNKKQSVERSCKEKSQKEKINFVDLSNSKTSKIEDINKENNNINNKEKKLDNENNKKTDNFSKKMSKDNKSTENLNNKDSLLINSEENNLNKNKKKISNINEKGNENEIINKIKDGKLNLNNNNKKEDKEINNNITKNNKIKEETEIKGNRNISDSLSKFSNLSKIDKTEENLEFKNIIQMNNNENNEINNNLQNEQNNKINQDLMSNLDKTVLSDSSSISKTILSPKAFSFLSNGNNIGMNLNSNNKSSFTKRVEYSNSKTNKRIFSPKFKKKLEEEPNLELFTEKLDEIKKMKLIQKMENDEEKLNNEINLLNNITADTTSSSINNSDNNNLNMIHLMAKKMLNNSIFGKYLINNKKPKKPIKADIENKFYTLQKYKNIIGMIEHLKNKIFKKKYIDFNYETFDDYLNDEDDKLFNQSLLKTIGIKRFIRNAKDCLYKKEKMNKRSQSKAYGLNTFKFNNAFQANQRPARFATTKKIDYNINIKKNFGYYRPKKLMNLSYLSSNANSKNKLNNKRRKLNNYTTTNYDSINSINYNLMTVNKKKRYLSSEKNTEYMTEKSSSIPKKIRLNIKTYKYNKNKNNGININVLNKIRDRITNNSVKNKYDVSSTKSKDKKYKYNSTNKNRSLEYDSDYNNRKYRNKRNNMSSSMNNIYESEESNSSHFNSSIEKEKTNNKNNSITYYSNDKTEEIKYEEEGIYQKNKNITTPELGSKFNNIFTKNDTNKYDNDDDHFINDNLPITVNINNLVNFTGSSTKRSMNENKEKLPINFNEIKQKEKIVKNNSSKSNDKILYNAIFSTKSSDIKKNNNNIPYLKKNKNTNKKKDISIKDNEKLNKEIWNMNKKNKKNNIDMDNEKNNNLNNTQIDYPIDNNENNNLNKTTFSISKKNIKKDIFKDLKDNTPIDLNCILNITINEVKSKSKIFFKKMGYFYNEKDNIIRATRGGTIIEISLLKICNESIIYFNTRIKTNDFKKEKEIIRKLIGSLNAKE